MKRTRVSYSSLSAHRRCPQQWNYQYVRGLIRADDTKVERDFGSWWHTMLAVDTLHRGREHGSLKSVPKVIKTVDGGPTFDPDTVEFADVLNSANHWWNGLDEDAQAEWLTRIGEPLPTRLDALYRRYRDRWDEVTKNEIPLAIEMEVEREIPGDAYLTATVDEVYLDKRRGIVVVRDHKTAKTLGQQSAIDDLMDSQLQLYAWAVAGEVVEWGEGKVRATAYNRARSVAPTLPQVTAQGNLSKATSLYDLQTYLDWAEGPDGEGVPWGIEDEFFKTGPRKGQPKFGRYTAEDSVIERLSSPEEQAHWFTRTLTPLNPNIIRAHLRAAQDGAKDIARSTKRVKRTGEAPRNLGAACRSCEFADLCRAEMYGGSDGDFNPEDYGLRTRQ